VVGGQFQTGIVRQKRPRAREMLGDTIFDEMRRVLAETWELSGKAESEIIDSGVA